MLSFDGYASNVRPRELLLDLFERMGLPQQGGSAVELCNQLRLAFAMSMQASATTKRAGSSCDEVVTLMLQLLPKGSEAKWAELDTSPMQAGRDTKDWQTTRISLAPSSSALVRLNSMAAQAAAPEDATQAAAALPASARQAHPTTTAVQRQQTLRAASCSTC